MKGDEFDGPGDGPIPPYERSWRHPAEIADDARNEFARRAAPPPLSRRTSVIVALLSIVASSLLLAVAVPKGVDRTADTTDVNVAPVPVKNASLSQPILKVNERAISALPVGGLLLVTSADAVEGASTVSVTIGGVSRTAAVIGIDDETSTAVVELTGDDIDNVDLGNVLPEIPPVALPENGMQVIHSGSGEMIPCHPSLELTNKSTTDRAPVITDGTLEGVGTILDAYGTPLGVAVRSQVATWMMSRQVIEDAVNRVLQARG